MCPSPVPGTGFGKLRLTFEATFQRSQLRSINCSYQESRFSSEPGNSNTVRGARHQGRGRMCADAGRAAEGEARPSLEGGSACESTLLAEAEGRRRKAAAQTRRLWSRERDHGGSAWESNPACPQLREATDFEDREGHRAPFASKEASPAAPEKWSARPRGAGEERAAGTLAARRRRRAGAPGDCGVPQLSISRTSPARGPLAESSAVNSTR